MADSLYDVIAPHLGETGFDIPIPSAQDPNTIEYLNSLTRLTHSALTTTEPQKLSSESQSVTRALQSLACRSYQAILQSSIHLDDISAEVPRIRSVVERLSEDEIPKLETAAMRFAKKYSRVGQQGQNSGAGTLARRREVLTLAGSADRISDILEIPALLSSAIAAGSYSLQNQGMGNNNNNTPNSPTPHNPATPATTTQSRYTSAAANSSYTSALDLFSHVKRLQTLYPHSRLIQQISQQASEEMKQMTTNLLGSLQSRNLKLAGAMRTIGWLRRIAPEFDSSWDWCPARPTERGGGKGENEGAGLAAMGIPNLSSEGSLGAVLLLCRLTNLINTLNALDPLRELADQELRDSGQKRTGTPSSGVSSPSLSSLSATGNQSWTRGQQTELYLKRYIEVFREQSFAIVSMFKGVFAPIKESNLTTTTTTTGSSLTFPVIPSALASFPLHLSDLLFSTLRVYLPALRDGPSREGICSQVLFCANSLGRLGADFGLLLAILLDDLSGDGSSESESEEGEVAVEGENKEEDGGGEGDEAKEQQSGKKAGGKEKEGNDPEWIDVFKKHKIQVSRLEMLATGVAAK